MWTDELANVNISSLLTHLDTQLGAENECLLSNEDLASPVANQELSNISQPVHEQGAALQDPPITAVQGSIEALPNQSQLFMMEPLIYSVAERQHIHTLYRSALRTLYQNLGLAHPISMEISMLFARQLLPEWQGMRVDPYSGISYTGNPNITNAHILPALNNIYPTHAQRLRAYMLNNIIANNTTQELGNSAVNSKQPTPK